MKIFHIRPPKLFGAHRIEQGTYCGAPATGHDIRRSWSAEAVGNYACCQACIDAKKAPAKDRLASLIDNP
jgi:hypothetical protein